MRLIDADKLKNEFKKSKGLISNFAVEMVDLSPTIDAAPVVHARWIDYEEPDENDNVQCYCSNCNKGDQHAIGIVVPYCWNCGAKMEAMED